MVDRYKITDVFTPGAFPTHTYVERATVDVERTLKNGLAVPGQIVSLAGPSKSGKTVLVERVVTKDCLIAVTGAAIRNAEQLWDRVLDWMGDPAEEAIASGTTLGGSVTGTAKGGASILGLVKGEVSAAGTAQATTQSTTTTKVPRRGMQQVIKEIGGSDFVILLDDFHYLDRAIQTQVAQQLKEAAR